MARAPMREPQVLIFTYVQTISVSAIVGALDVLLVADFSIRFEFT